MPRLTVKIIKPNLQGIQKQIDRKSQNIQAALVDMAKDAAEYMASYVENHTRRKPATGKLAKAIRSGVFVTYHEKDMSIGIGAKNRLPKYWYVVNYGGYVPPMTVGSFGGQRPSSSRQNQRFSRGVRNYRMTPKRAIRPMNYIQATKNHFMWRWNRVAQKAAK